MTNSQDRKPDPLEAVVGGCLFPLIGGFFGVVIGIIGSLFMEPFVTRMYREPGNKFSGVFEVGIVSLAITVASGLTGLIAFSYFELKRRK